MIHKLVEKIENIPVWLMAGVLFLLNFYQLFWSSIVKDGFKWYFIHENFFFTLIGFLIVLLFKNKKISFQLSVVIFSFLFLKYTFIFEIISNWLFFKSSFKYLFDNLAAKDENVIAVIFIFSLFFINLILEIINKLNKKYNLKRIFALLCCTVILGTTVIFHYYIINKNLNYLKSDILQRMNKVSNIEDRISLKKLCIYEGYYCVIGNQLKDFSTSSPAILNFVKNNIDSHQMTSGSFVFIENNKQKFVSIIRKNDIWIFDETSYALAFHKAEATFLILCCWAHGFWILFLSFLILFHFRRANKK